MYFFKWFLIVFSLVYIVLSLPTMLGFGVVIDWVPEATVFQKFKGYVIEGLAESFGKKLIMSSIIGIIVSYIFFR